MTLSSALILFVAAISTLTTTDTMLASAAFVFGADMSYSDVLDCDNTCSPYKESYSGAVMDPLLILKENGITTVRMRIWNNPAPPNNYCNLAGVLQMAKRVFQHDMQFNLDFHYSDTWADPGHQTKPAAWAKDNGGAQLVSDVHDYTYQVMTALQKQGTLPQFVQIGNEIDSGLLWAPAGQPCEYGGYISSPCQSNWAYFASLIAAGVSAVRAVSAQTEIMIHTSLGNSLAGGPAAVDWIHTWYNDLYHTYDVKFDAIGLSFYPGFCACKLNALYLLKDFMKDYFPTLKLYIAETSYPYEGSHSWTGDFPFTPNGQRHYASELLSMLRNGSISNFNGIYWWGTEYYTSTDDHWAPLWNNTKPYAIALPAQTMGWK